MAHKLQTFDRHITDNTTGVTHCSRFPLRTYVDENNQPPKAMLTSNRLGEMSVCGILLGPAQWFCVDGRPVDCLECLGD